VWGERPLLVRSTYCAESGNTPALFLEHGGWMEEQGVDRVDGSSGGIKKIKVKTFPNDQVPPRYFCAGN